MGSLNTAFIAGTLISISFLDLPYVGLGLTLFE